MFMALMMTIALTAPQQTKLEQELVAKYGDAQRARIVRGIHQVAQFWRAEDGDDAALEEFVRTNFAGDQKALDSLFDRSQFLFESLDGHMNDINRDWRRQTDLDIGPVYPFDEITFAYDPSAHVNDDLFKNKFAFIVLLNFPLTSLQERLAQGEWSWSRRQWAEANLALRFSKRIPAEAAQAVSRAQGEASQFVNSYNIWMHHLLDDEGKRLFPAKMRLLSHWNLRDEIKANYALDRNEGLPKQRMIQRVMERIVDQSIPNAVVDNPGVDWNPNTNSVKPSPAKDGSGSAAVRNDDSPRYAMILGTFHAQQEIDKYSPTAPTHIQRRFEEQGQIPEQRVRGMFQQVLLSPFAGRVARLIQQRLGRPLEPFDIWYNGFRPRSEHTEAQLDEIVRKRYPNAEGYKRDMPGILMKLGFSRERAEYLGANIEVDPARGSGHAWPAQRRDANPHLRTRIGADGMDYKGYNIAVHEMGHNVEQVFSLKNIDHYTLSGVPNNAFTEALAFVFQAKDMELLGLSQPSPQSSTLKTLNDFWGTFEIAGAALVEMDLWRWMYEHPKATPAELRDATVQISKNVWNRYYAPLFNRRDVTLLGIYSHMVDYMLYLPNYPIGHLIAHQVEHQIERAGSIGPEFERMATMGSVTPDFWMRNAAGTPVGAEALLAATERAIQQMAPVLGPAPNQNP